MRTLSEDGWRLVRSGVTTAEEVMRVTKDQSFNEAAKPKIIETEAPAEAEPVAAAGNQKYGVVSV